MTGRSDGRTALVTGPVEASATASLSDWSPRAARPSSPAATRTRWLRPSTSWEGPERVVAVSGRADDLEDQAATVQTAIDRFGSLDIVMNNAGINPVFGPSVKIDLAAGRKIVEVNCNAALSRVQYANRSWSAEYGSAVLT